MQIRFITVRQKMPSDCTVHSHQPVRVIAFVVRDWRLHGVLHAFSVLLVDGSKSALQLVPCVVVVVVNAESSYQYIHRFVSFSHGRLKKSEHLRHQKGHDRK